MHNKRPLLSAFLLLSFCLLSGLTHACLAGNEGKTISDYRVKAIENAVAGNADLALDQLNTAVSMASSHYGANSSYVSSLYYDMGTIALNASWFPKAQNYLQKALDANPNSVDARIQLAELMNLMGQTNASKTELARVLSKHPDSGYARKTLIRTYEEEGSAAQATKESFVLANVLNGRFKNPPRVVVVTTPAVTVPSKEPLSSPIEQLGVKQQEIKKANENKIDNKKAEIKIPAVKIELPKQKAKSKSRNEIKHQRKEKIKQEIKALEVKSVKHKRENKPEKTDVLSEPENTEEQQAGGFEEPVPAKASKPDIKPQKAARAKAASIKSPRRGLVPPPPPIVPVFPAIMPVPPVKTEAPPPAKKVKKEKAASESVKEDKPSHSGVDEDSDFLLDWADAKAKKKK